jgi:hypothetical protein
VLAAVLLLFVLTHTPCQRVHFSLAYSLCTLFATLPPVPHELRHLRRRVLSA